jgi:hypothetical protein
MARRRRGPAIHPGIRAGPRHQSRLHLERPPGPPLLLYPPPGHGVAAGASNLDPPELHGFPGAMMATDPTPDSEPPANGPPAATSPAPPRAPAGIEVRSSRHRAVRADRG